MNKWEYNCKRAIKFGLIILGCSVIRFAYLYTLEGIDGFVGWVLICAGIGLWENSVKLFAERK